MDPHERTEMLEDAREHLRQAIELIRDAGLALRGAAFGTGRRGETTMRQAGPLSPPVSIPASPAGAATAARTCPTP